MSEDADVSDVGSGEPEGTGSGAEKATGKIRLSRLDRWHLGRVSKRLERRGCAPLRVSEEPQALSTEAVFVWRAILGLPTLGVAVAAAVVGLGGAFVLGATRSSLPSLPFLTTVLVIAFILYMLLAAVGGWLSAADEAADVIHRRRHAERLAGGGDGDPVSA